jgi:hypothetical protein
MSDRQTFAFYTKINRLFSDKRVHALQRRKFSNLQGLAILFALVMPIIACNESAQPWQSFGEITTETRLLDSFSQINASHSIQLFIKQDLNAPESVTITYGKNVMQGIVSEINEGELILDDRNKAKWLRNLNILPICTLNVHQINKIRLEGNAKLTCLDTLKTPALQLNINSVEEQNLLIKCGQLYGGIENSGHLNASGIATIFSWSCEKGSGLDARALLSDDVYMRHFTIRDVYVNPTKQFEGFVYNTGNLYYFTQPTYKFKVVEEGSGKVKLYQP